MNAVKVFESKVKRIKSIDKDGTIIFETDILNEQDVEDLKHLCINNINGIIFDDREIK